MEHCAATASQAMPHVVFGVGLSVRLVMPAERTHDVKVMWSGKPWLALRSHPVVLFFFCRR